jgi:tRNA1(Val) A37 N6-methylase TrmN6
VSLIPNPQSLIPITEDALLNGRVLLRQPAKGYRANADTVLLGAAVEAPDDARLLEAGCGAGGALLVVAQRSRARFVGVERDPQMAKLARENVAANGEAGRIEIIEGDALALTGLGVFDGVFFNPPFDLEGEGALPAQARRGAQIAEAPIADWVKRLSNLLRGGAALTLIHRARALPEILEALEGRLGGIEIVPVRPRAGAAAKRVLVRARKGSRAPLNLYAGFELHDESGAKFTQEAEAIFRGEAVVEWK